MPNMRNKATGIFGIVSGRICLDAIVCCIFTVAIVLLLFLLQSSSSLFGFVLFALIVNGTNRRFVEFCPLVIGIQRWFGVAKDPVCIRVAIQHIWIDDCLGLPGVQMTFLRITSGWRCSRWTLKGSRVVGNAITTTAIGNGIFGVLGKNEEVPSHGADNGQDTHRRECAAELTFLFILTHVVLCVCVCVWIGLIVTIEIRYVIWEVSCRVQ
mmetsp:Transcript_2457/g.5359  ORF Transcript_2457/g.5359 Transcript_2457/m.5359 type:complete len:211 (+) Transcript_2457:940-1572(+)